jgi:putative DNA methylase
MYAYKIEADGPGSPIRYHVVGPMVKANDFDFDPGQGTTRGGTATCPCCDTPLSEKHIIEEAQHDRMGAEIVAVVWEGANRKVYVSVRPEDRSAFLQAEKRLQHLVDSHDPLGGELAPVPDEPMPPHGTLGFRVQRYGVDTWGKLFNPRQALALATFAKYVREACAAITQETGDADYAKAVTTYLAINVDRLADRCCVLCRWDNGAKYETIINVFSRQALPMVWDYAEVNPFNTASGGWEGAGEWIMRFVEHSAASAPQAADVRRGSATKLPFEDGYFDAVITDPPYYDNVPYSDLSDFFYVWLRRTVGTLYPTVLGTPLTPKEQEITQDPSKNKSKADFERMLTEAFAESARVLKDDGICVVVYAHKAISAWESLVDSLIKAGLAVDASWPFSTEMGNRLRGMNSAALASSIFLVCRKRTVDAGVGIAGDVRGEIEANVRASLDRFWEAGLRGADFFISAIGPATAAFSRYDKVMDLRGNEITVTTLLEWVQQTVADYALRRVFTVAAGEQGNGEGTKGLGSVDDYTRFYVLWRWTYDAQASAVGTLGENGAAKKGKAIAPDAAEGEGDAEDEEGGGGGKSDRKKIPFGDAHLMATALGADVGALINRYQILEGSSNVQLVRADERAERVADFGEHRADGSPPPLIDVLHRCELLWASGAQDALDEYLDEFAPEDLETLRRVAQALVDLLPRGDAEKQRLEGFLYSGVAQRGDGTRPRPSATVQEGLGDDFGAPGKVIRDKKKGYGRR